MVALGGEGMRARSVAQLQRHAGNQAIAAMLASVQRCNGEVHEGCACADTEAAVQRQSAAAGDRAVRIPVQRQAGSDTPARVEQPPAGGQGPDPWAGPPSTTTSPAGAAGASATPAGATPAGATPAAPSNDVGPVITAEQVDDREFTQVTGLPADMLPEGVMVKDLSALSKAVRDAPAEMLPPGVAPDPTRRELNAAVAGAAVATASPVSYVPANATGIMWVQGHLSIFAKVNGTLTIRGFRGNLAYYTGEMLPGPPGQWFSKQLNIGVPGSFVNDLAFTKMPGKQTVIYVAVDADTATAFRDELNATKYNEPYKYSAPRPDAKPGGKEWRMRQFLIAKGGEAMAVQCGNNCITVPVSQIESAIGMRPQVEVKGGRLDVTSGRIGEGPVDPHAKGRAAHLRDFVDAPDLAKAKPGAKRIGMTPTAVKTMGVVRIGGGIYLVYGGYESVDRLIDAWRNDQFAQAAAEEGAAWTGGFLGGELGGAIAAGIGERVLLVTGGEVGATFVVGSAASAFLVGYLGAKLGVSLVRAVFDAPRVLIWATTTFLEGFMDVSVAAGNVIHGTLVDVMLRPVVVARAQIDPNNWDLRGLPPEAGRAVRNLGMAAWSTLGSLDPTALRDAAGKTFAELGVPPAVAAEVSRAFVPAGVLITSDDILSRTPLDLVQYLRKSRSLDFVQDPEVLADDAVEPQGHKFDEAYLNVHLVPMIATRARINPNNWDLRAVNPGAGAGDVRAVGRTVWRQLSSLKKEEFGPASRRSLAAFGVSMEAMLAAVKAMTKSKTFGMEPVAGEEVPADVLADYAQQMLEVTPEDFAGRLEESGMRYVSDPGGIANAALRWLRAGYQPW
jgi:hypothetical protein